MYEYCYCSRLASCYNRPTSISFSLPVVFLRFPVVLMFIVSPRKINVVLDFSLSFRSKYTNHKQINCWSIIKCIIACLTMRVVTWDVNRELSDYSHLETNDNTLPLK